MNRAWKPVEFAKLAGWNSPRNGGFVSAFDAFTKSAIAVGGGHDFSSKKIGVREDALRHVLTLALDQPEAGTNEELARSFFEQHFQPWKLEPIDSIDNPSKGMLTGYYEPVLDGALQPSQQFSVPLYRRPHNLVEIKFEEPHPVLPADWPQQLRFGRRSEGGFVPYFDRRAIEGTEKMRGALSGQNLELVWLTNQIDAFFVHIQGSACIVLQDGTRMRVSYAGKSGHDYTPIGRVLRDRGDLPRPTDKGRITMRTIREWLHDHPDQQQDVFHQNRSFIFFQEECDLEPNCGPRAAAGVQLTPNSSLAIDRTLHTFHTPIYICVEENVDLENRLMIAQDTGSAILGVERGDWFAGSGDTAGQIAGRLQLGCEFVVLVPRIQKEPLVLPEGYMTG